jgi:competence protein ComEC
MKRPREPEPPYPLPPLIPAAVSLIAGVTAACAFPFFPFTVSIFSLAALILLFLYKRLSMSSRITAVVFYLAGFAAFFICGPGAPSRVSALIGRGPVAFTGEVARPPEQRDGYTAVYLRPYPHSGLRPGLVRLNMKGAGNNLEYGDVVSAVLELGRPHGFLNPGVPDWGAYAAINGTDAVARVKPGSLKKLGNRAFPPLRRLYAFRSGLSRMALSGLDGQASAIFRAMVLGDEGGITTPIRDAFAASGTTHILSVSGTHVAILAGLVFLLVRWSFGMLPHRAYLRLSLYVDRRKVAAAAAIPAAAAYCLLAGSHVATVRSVIMLSVYLLSVVLDRDEELLNTISLAAIAVVLYDPSSVFDISFQLSFGCVLLLAVAAKSFSGPPALFPGDTARRWRFISWAGATLMMSASVIIGVSPVIAGRFNSFSTTAIPANLLVVPLAGFLVVPVGLVSCTLQAVTGGTSLPFAWLNGFLLDLVYALVRLFASPSWSNLHPGAPGTAMTVLFYAGIAVALSWRAGRARKGAAALACAAFLFAYDAIPAGHTGNLKVTFLDVGQGDSALVETPGGKRLLIDGGGNPQGMDPGRSAVAPYLWNHGIRKLDVVVLTHPHADHAAGLCYILEHFEVGQVWEGGEGADTPEYRRFGEVAKERHIPRHVLTGVGETAVGGVEVQALHSSSSSVDDSEMPEYSRQNDRSLVLRIKYRDVSFLFAGDVEARAEEAMISYNPPLPLRSTVLKVPHHGLKSALYEPFMDAVRPAVAVISAREGAYNAGPSPETLSFLEGLGSRVLVTDDSGAITLTTDGKALDISTYSERARRHARAWEEERENLKKLLARTP